MARDRPTTATTGRFISRAKVTSMSAEELRERKRALRKSMVERILALDRQRRRQDEALLAARFVGLPGFATARSVLLYVTAFPEEIATGPLLEQTLERGK